MRSVTGGDQELSDVRAPCVGHIAGVSIAVGHVNEGNLTEALDILDHIIATTTGAHLSGAHVARGTARAMLRDLQGCLPSGNLSFFGSLSAWPHHVYSGLLWHVQGSDDHGHDAK